jgi:hypothetical protein
VFPGIQGGPLMHVIAAKAVAFKEAMEPGFKEYQQQVVKNAQTMAEVFIARGYEVVSGGTDDHLFLVSFIEQGLTGKDVDAWLGSGQHHGQQERGPQRPAVALCDQRHPCRHARHHHARLRHARGSAIGRLDVRPDRRPRRSGGDRCREGGCSHSASAVYER